MKAPRVGVFIIRKGDNRPPAALGSDTWNLSNEMMVEEFVPGRELTVVGDGRHARWASPRSPPIWNSTTTKPNTPPAARSHILPAQDSGRASPTKRMALAVRAHQALGCRGVTRTDFRYDDTGAQAPPDPAGDQHPARHDADLAGAGTGRPSRHVLRQTVPLDRGGRLMRSVKVERKPRASRRAASRAQAARGSARTAVGPSPARRARQGRDGLLARLGRPRWRGSFRRPMLAADAGGWSLFAFIAALCSPAA